MNKIEVIARRILGWKLHSWNKWYDYEKGTFIENFQPDQNLDHAMMIIKKMEEFGFVFTKKSDREVCFNNTCESGKTLAEAITNAAFSIADNRSVPEEWL